MCGGGCAEPALRAKPDHVTTDACAWTMAKGNPFNKGIIRWMESRKSDARNLPVARDATVQGREAEPRWRIRFRCEHLDPVGRSTISNEI